MTSAKPHAHGIGMRIAVIVLSLLLVAMVILFFLTTGKIAAGAAELADGTTTARDGSADLAATANWAHRWAQLAREA